MISLASRSMIVVATLAASVGTLAAMASAYDGIDRRQANQSQRINQGIRSGELTRSEVARLEAQQAHIRDLERRAKADGRVDRYERFVIGRAQQQASRSIYAEKHDRNDRHHRRWYRWW